VARPIMLHDQRMIDRQVLGGLGRSHSPDSRARSSPLRASYPPG
jgi:hypothetical protein